MPTINQLSAVDQINDGDQFPLYSPNAGDARKASFTTVKESLADDFASLADLAASTGSSLVGHIATGAGATARTVQDKLREIVSVRDFGAVGDGVANDTAAIQTAINAAISLNKELVIPAGTYNVTNLTLPHVTIYDTSSPWWSGALRVVGELGAVIKRISGGDTNYMVASNRWVNNVAFGTSPVWFENIRFDGSSIAQDVFVNVGYGSVFKNCFFENATRHGFVEPVTTANGTPLNGARCCSKYVDCTFRNNAHTGFVVADAVGGVFITDCWFTDCSAYNNGRRNIDIGQAAGWKITGNHAWHSAATPDPGETWGVRIKNLKSAVITDNVWEGFGTQTYGLFIEVDGFGGALGSCEFLLGLGLTIAWLAPSTVKLDNCRFTEAGAKMRLATNSSGAKVIDEGSIYAEANPYTFSGGFNSATEVYADNVTAASRLLNGRQRDSVNGGICTNGYVGWDTTSDYQCDDLTPAIVGANGNATGTRIFRLDQNPMAGMVRTLTRPSFTTGIVELRRFADSSTWFNVSPGTNVTVAYNGFSWTIIDFGTTT